jgi:hypothetical protein
MDVNPGRIMRASGASITTAVCTVTDNDSDQRNVGPRPAPCRRAGERIERRLVRVLPVAALAIAAGCGSEAGAASRWMAETDTVGDTVVVRTLSGGVWGGLARLEAEVMIGEMEGDDEYLLGSVRGLAVDEPGNMYIYDSQVPAVRKYDPTGRYVMTLGREGGGPGEYKQSDGGIAVLKNGNIVLRDQGNGRFQLWTPDGEPMGEWRYRGGFFTSTPMYTDTLGNAYSSTMTFDGKPPWKTMLVRYNSNGEAVDTMPVPEWDYEVPSIVAQSTENGRVTGTSSNNVPFSPTKMWAYSPFGYYVGALSTRYAVDLYKPSGVLRIERVVDPVAVNPDEKSNAEENTTANMRQMVSDWKWNGPSIPDTKPPIRSLIVARDGRIWVQLSTPGQRIPDDELPEPRRGPDDRPLPQIRWRESIAFDVFEPDGRYVGMVTAPTGFSMNPSPVIRGDVVWAIVRDEFDVQRLARLRVVQSNPGDEG